MPAAPEWLEAAARPRQASRRRGRAWPALQLQASPAHQAAPANPPRRLQAQRRATRGPRAWLVGGGCAASTIVIDSAARLRISRKCFWTNVPTPAVPPPSMRQLASTPVYRTGVIAHCIRRSPAVGAARTASPTERDHRRSQCRAQRRGSSPQPRAALNGQVLADIEPASLTHAPAQDRRARSARCPIGELACRIWLPPRRINA